MNRGKKSLRHVAMVAKFLEFAAVSNLIDLAQFHLICQMSAKFPGVEFETMVSKFSKRKRKFFVVFTYFMKRGHESRKFHVAGRAMTTKKSKKKKK